VCGYKWIGSLPFPCKKKITLDAKYLICHLCFLCRKHAWNSLGWHPAKDFYSLVQWLPFREGHAHRRSFQGFIEWLGSHQLDGGAWFFGDHVFVAIVAIVVVVVVVLLLCARCEMCHVVACRFSLASLLEGTTSTLGFFHPLKKQRINLGHSTTCSSGQHAKNGKHHYCSGIYKIRRHPTGECRNRWCCIWKHQVFLKLFI